MLIWVTLTAVAFAGGVFLHAPITTLCDDLVQRLGFPTYERLAAAAALILMVLTAATLRLRATESSSTTWPFLLALFGLAALAQPWLILINIENVHFVQYAVLAMLLARCGLAPERAWLTATGLGICDEAYQLLFLRFGRPDRLDWNDITFNSIGAAIGVVILLHLGWSRPRGGRHTWVAIVAILAPLVIAALLVAPPVFSPFYSVTPHGLRSHELTPGEGVSLVGLVWIAINCLVRRLASRQGAARESPIPAATAT
jgi:hypothetical protein